MAGDHHRHALRDASTNKVPDATPAEIVEEPGRGAILSDKPGLPTSRLPGRPEVLNPFPVTEENPRALRPFLVPDGPLHGMVLKRIALEKSKVTFWTHTELAQAVARRMAEVQEGVPDFLLGIIKKQEFRHYDPDEEVDAKEQLQLQSAENRSLYIRLAAYAAIGCAATKDVGC